MKFRAFKYFLKEGFRSIWINGVVSITSIFTVMASLIVLGLFLIITLNVNHLVAQVNEQYEIAVYLKDDIDQTKIVQVGDNLSRLEGIASFELVTKEERFTKMIDEMFSDKKELVSGVDNFFEDAYYVKLTNLNDAKIIATKISYIEGIDRVKSNREIEEGLLQVSNVVNIISLWMYLLLTIVSISIITNTIRIAVFARRKEINIMKFIGATNWFIRWPFIIEGMIIGFLAALIAIGIIFLGYNYAVDYMTNISGEFVGLKMLGKMQMMGLLSVILLVVGTLVGTIGSGISVRKHMKV